MAVGDPSVTATYKDAFPRLRFLLVNGWLVAARVRLREENGAGQVGSQLGAVPPAAEEGVQQAVGGPDHERQLGPEEAA